MDPLSVIGGLSAALQIVEAITKTIKNLNNARTRFSSADATIHLLITELIAIKSSLSHIQDWAEYNFKHGPAHHELLEGFRVSIEGCDLAMQAMAEEVNGLMSNNPFWRGTKFVWNEESMKEHHQRLHSQCAALQMLLQAARCHTDMQQKSVLRQPQNIRIIQKVVDDASSLRTSRAQSYMDVASVSGRESTVGSTIFDMDHELVTSNVYQKNLAYHEAKARKPAVPIQTSVTTTLINSSTNPSINRSTTPSINPSTNPFRKANPTIITSADSIGDSGFFDEDAAIVNASIEAQYREAMKRNKHQLTHRSVSDSASHPPRLNTHIAPQPQPPHDELHDQLSPLDRWKQEPWQKPDYNTRPSPDSTYGSIVHSRPTRNVSSASAPAVPLYVPPPSGGQQAGDSILRRLTKRASKANLMPPVLKRSPSNSNPGTPITPVPGNRRIKRTSESNIHISIDFCSPDGLSAPDIVRAAQANSAMEIERLLENRANIEAKHEPTARTALAVAAHCGNDLAMDMLLRHNARVDLVDTTGYTPIHLAASRGHYRAVELLLENHADPNTPGPDGKSALRLASDGGYSEVVQLLLYNRARVNTRDHRNFTPLHAAAKNGDEDTVKLLMSYNADVEAKDGEMMTACHYAAQGNFDVVVHTLIARGANIESPGKSSMTPLAVACASGSLQVANLLLSKKANTKCKAENDLLPIHWASFNGHDEIVNLFVQKKGMVDVRTGLNQTPLHLAAQARSFPVADLLLRKDADIEAQCSHGFRPLHYACSGKHTDPELIKLLLGYNAQVEAMITFGSRPLHLAALDNHPNAVELLLAKGASIEARDGKGERPLGIACTQGHLAVVRVLLDRGAAMKLKSPRASHEDSMLCKAVAAGHIDIVQELLRRGASVRERDEINWPPLRHAAYHGRYAIVEFLLTRGATTIGLELSTGLDIASLMSKIGFASDVDRQTRISISRLLKDANDREEIPQRMAEDDPFLTTRTTEGGVSYIFEAA